MNRPVAGTSIHLPILLDSRENSANEEERSTVTHQTQASGIYGNDVDQDAVDSAVGLINNYSALYKPFEPAKMVYYGEKDRIKAIRVPFAVEPTRNEAKRASPKPSTNRHGRQNSVPNEALGVQARGVDGSLPMQGSGVQDKVPNEVPGFQALGVDVSLLMQGSGVQNHVPKEAPGVQAQAVEVSLPMQGGGVRRSSRKRNEAIYNEDLLANRLPRLSRRKGGSAKKKPTHSLRIRASNHYPIDSDEDGESE